MELDLAFGTARAMQSALRSRAISARELVETAIARIETHDAAINAVVVRDFERARKAAAQADASRAKDDDRPLLGIPMTVKEAQNVEGLKTSWGVPAFKDFVAPEDGAAIARLRRAGAIIVGKSNVPPFLADWQSDNPLYGRTNNPYDLTRTSGGSTGGAAALASGMVPLEFGSDLAGSIRVPAAFCGIYGHKPSFGIVPTRGFRPPHAPDGAAIPISVLGPLARSADDLELVLDAVAGPDDPEARAYRLALPAPRHNTLTDFRVLIIDHHPAAAVDEEIAGALNELAAALEKERAKVTRQSELLPDLMETLDCFGAIIRAVTSRGGPPSGKPMSAHEWMELCDRQHCIGQKWAALFDAFDIVLAPAFGCAAFPHDSGQGERWLSINGKKTPYAVQGAWSSMAGLVNLPATAAPIGKTRNGLPMGVQVVGPYLEDRTTIRFAQLLTTVCEGFVPPKFAV